MTTQKTPLLLVYTGTGKGKTSACVGQAIRALGQGHAVAFGQFMKRADQAGEQKMLAKLLEENFMARGEGFLRNVEERPKHRAAAVQLLAWATQQAGQQDILLLDEALYALQAEIVTQDELQELIKLCKIAGTHLVLSGRGAPDWLLEQADLVTEMKEIKHPFEKGIKAQKGIEF